MAMTEEVVVDLGHTLDSLLSPANQVLIFEVEVFVVVGVWDLPECLSLETLLAALERPSLSEADRPSRVNTRVE